MRRCIQLSRAVMASPGMLSDAVNNTNLRPYIFLDSLVRAAKDGGTYIGNLYTLGQDVTNEESVMFLPILVSILAREIETEATAQEEFGLSTSQQIFLDRDSLGRRLADLGFSPGITDLGLLNARNRRFLTAVNGDLGLVGYVVNRNLTLAHSKLMFEAAYTDNMAQDLRSVPDLSTINETVGYDTRFFGKRCENSMEFITWLKRNEQKWIKHPKVRQAKSFLIDEQVPSIAHGVAWHYASRLYSILERKVAPADAEVAISRVVNELLRECRELGVTKESIKSGAEYKTKRLGDLIN